MNWTWLIAIVSIIGTIANIHKKRYCFLIWLFSNSLWMLIDLHARLYSQAFLFLVYVAMSVWGLVKWNENQPGKAAGWNESEA